MKFPRSAPHALANCRLREGSWLDQMISWPVNRINKLPDIPSISSNRITLFAITEHVQAHTNCEIAQRTNIVAFQ